MANSNSILSVVVVILLLIIIAICVYCLFYNGETHVSKDNQDKITSLENDVKSLQDNITALQNDFKNKNKNIIEITDTNNNFDLTPLQIIDTFGYGTCGFLVQSVSTASSTIPVYGTILTIIPKKEMQNTYITQLFLAPVSLTPGSTSQIYIRTSNDDIKTLINNTGKNTWQEYRPLVQKS
jgi:hypothetical protein